MLDNLDILIIAPVFNLTLLINGLLIGAIFALTAYGLALVWGVMNVKNLAQGVFVMAGGYICWWLWGLGVHPLLGLVLSAAIMWGVGWVIFKTVIRLVLDRDLFTSLLASFGVAIVMEQTLNILFGPDTQTIDLGYDSLRMFDGAVSIGVQKIIAFVLAVMLALGVVLFMQRSRMGQAIRATAQNPRAARVMGIDTEKVYSFTFCLNSAICGAAGSLIVMIWLIQPFYGIPYSIRAFVIVTAAGLGNLPGVIAVGFGMGVIEQYGGFVIGAAYQQAIVVGLLLAVLVFRLVQLSRKRQVVQ
jgi:branched-chain amino acid transport system permease protein